MISFGIFLTVSFRNLFSIFFFAKSSPKVLQKILFGSFPRDYFQTYCTSFYWYFTRNSCKSTSRVCRRILPDIIAKNPSENFEEVSRGVLQVIPSENCAQIPLKNLRIPSRIILLYFVYFLVLPKKNQEFWRRKNLRSYLWWNHRSN